MPSKSTPFTPSSILVRPRRSQPRWAWVEPPGTAPGAERFIATAIYRHSRVAPAPRNIGGKGYRRKSRPRVSRETNPIKRKLKLRFGVLPARGSEDLMSGAGIERGDAEPDDKVRPGRGREGGRRAGGHDRDIGQRVVARRQERGLAQAAARMAIARQQKGAGQVDGQRPGTGPRQRCRVGHDRQ